MFHQLAVLCFMIILGSTSGSPGNLRELPNSPAQGSDVAKFIVGGRKAAEGQFPYLVSLRTTWNMHFCGGAILNSRWILSAAHCTTHLVIPEIVAGTTRASEGGEHYALSRIVVHPNYNSDADPFADDICLLQTNRTIEFSHLVRPIPLHRDRFPSRSSGVIAGWGWTEGGNHLNPENFFPVYSEHLNYIEVNVLSHVECTLRLSGWAVFLRTNHICTFGRGVGVCTFDSGSPVVADGAVVGVVSFVVPCAMSFPDWGPRVSSYTRWIDSVARDLS